MDSHWQPKYLFFHQGFSNEYLYLQLMFYFGDGLQHALWQYWKMVVEKQETFFWGCIYVRDLGRSEDVKEKTPVITGLAPLSNALQN